MKGKCMISPKFKFFFITKVQLQKREGCLIQTKCGCEEFYDYRRKFDAQTPYKNDIKYFLMFVNKYVIMKKLYFKVTILMMRRYHLKISLMMIWSIYLRVNHL